MKIAKVIVDVPVMQTNRPFDYEIPRAMTPLIQKGLRVVVSFGKGNRLLQGYVVDIVDKQAVSTPLKPIVDIIDLEPVLTPELLELSDWLAKSTYAFRITCLQTILPGVMRGSYDKVVHVLQPDYPQLPTFLKQAAPVVLDDQVGKSELAALLKLRQAGVIRFEYQVHNKAKIKTQRAIMLSQSAESLLQQAQALPERLKKQKELLHYLARQTADADFVWVKTVQSLFSASVLKTALKHQLITIKALEVKRRVLPDKRVAEAPRQLLPDQKRAVAAIDQATNNKLAKVFLVEGVTGSGKTEVYLQTMQRALDLNKSALMLVPEIALTPQMVQRVFQRFGNQVAVLHSGLSEGEKYDEWRRIREGKAKVVVGARSAVFAPLENIGIIIMDEEHEYSYKQEDTPRYHARNVAIHRAAYHHCPLVLGSATPSLESRARAKRVFINYYVCPHG
ncbi:helicase PriA [Agrilactobacillus composti DSM 18527 = JCM 14202]|nr:helicase PriA [Agrilactobacillus composti DSM 18527 = JCM 14202]